MTIHEYGKENEKVVILIHPSVVMWDYFENVIPLMEGEYHLLIPALPGYDPDEKSNFTSIEEIAEELERFLAQKKLTEISCVYGCSMGGAVVTRMLGDNRLKIKSVVIDGGITPYQLPWLITRFIAMRDFLMVSMGKIGGIKLLEKAFGTDDYSEEDLRYVVKVLNMISAKTIWRTFDSWNNYSMPGSVQTDCEKIEYWFAESEAKARKWDIAYIKKSFPRQDSER